MDSYRTSDMHLAVFLRSRGETMTEAHRNGQVGRIVFLFSDSQKLRRLVWDYFNTPVDGHNMNARTFLNELDAVRGLIKNLPEGGPA